MPLSNDQLIDALARFNNQQIRLAGQRYTPGVDPGAPNLQVAPLLTAIENVACGSRARERFLDFARGLVEAWDRAKHACNSRETIQTSIDGLGAQMIALLPRMRARDATALDDWTAYLSNISAALEEEQRRWQDEDTAVAASEAEAKVTGERGYSSRRDTIRSNINSISRCIGAITDEKEFVGSAASKALADPFLLVRGEWGTGKTHLLCDVTQNRVSGRQAALLILAKGFQGNVLEELCGQITPKLTPHDLLNHLQEIGASRGERSLIIVDGVNEGRRPEWRQAIGELMAFVRCRTHVGVIVSCRTPFERIAIAESDLLCLHEVTHRGFDDQEFDAQAAFFHHYKLPLPEVPLLAQLS